MRRIICYFNDRVKHLTIWDVKLVQGAAMLLAVIIVKLIPPILDVSIWWFAAAAVVIAIRPMWAFFGRGRDIPTTSGD